MSLEGLMNILTFTFRLGKFLFLYDNSELLSIIIFSVCVLKELDLFLGITSALRSVAALAKSAYALTFFRI